MKTGKIDVVWPEVCIGCGEKRIGMKDASYRWRNTEPVGSTIQSLGPMISFKVQAQLCEECAEESKMLRKANAAWNQTIWLMKFFFFLLFPSALIIIATDLVHHIPDFEYVYVPAILALTYPMFAVFVTFHDLRMKYLTSSIPAAAYITINPITWGRSTILFVFRNEQYKSVFQKQNPTLESLYSPTVGGDITNPKKFPMMKAIAIVSPTIIAIMLTLLLLLL